MGYGGFDCPDIVLYEMWFLDVYKLRELSFFAHNNISTRTVSEVILRVIIL